MNYSIKKLIKEVLENDIKDLKNKYRNVKGVQVFNNNIHKLNEVIYLQKLEPKKYILVYNYEYKQKRYNTNKVIYKYTVKEVVFKIEEGKNKIVEIQLHNKHTFNKVIKINLNKLNNTFTYTHI